MQCNLVCRAEGLEVGDKPRVPCRAPPQQFLSSRYRADERFAMCSTHKFVSAAAVLTLVDQGHMSLDRRVPYMRADLLDYAPINQGTCRRWFHDGGWPLCRRDRLERQQAANLLLGLLDGSSAGPVMFARSGTPSPGSTVPSRT